MNSKKQPIAVDDAYRIRDNQFWYNDCKFRDLIKNKDAIEVNIDGLGILILKHSKRGSDKRITLSYKFPLRSDRDWWKEHRGESVRVKLLVNGI